MKQRPPSLIEQLRQSAEDAWRSLRHENDVVAKDPTLAAVRRRMTVWYSAALTAILLLAVLLLPIDVGVRRLRIGRRELDAILAALPRRATSGAQRTATIHPLVAMRLRRSQRGATAASPAAQPPPPSARGAVAGTASHAPAPTPWTAPSMRAPSTPSPEEESTASKLLAARRKRRSS